MSFCRNVANIKSSANSRSLCLFIGYVEIVVTLEDGTTSVVRIGSAKDESSMLNAIVGLGKVMPTKGNARGKTGDVGDMFALGYRSFEKCIVYVPTKKEEISDAMAEASTEAGVYLRNIGQVITTIFATQII
jgi:hypothetical protein